MHLAAKEGYTRITELLLEKSCNKDVLAGQVYMCQTVFYSLHLTRATVHLNLQEGCTALHLAAAEGYIEIVELLIKRGCNMDVQTNKVYRCQTI